MAEQPVRASASAWNAFGFRRLRESPGGGADLGISPGVIRTRQLPLFSVRRSLDALPRCPLYASLDFFRGVACLLIVVFHSFFYVSRPDAGVGNIVVRVVALFWAGVPLFFVISGYCISASVDSHRRSDRSIADYFTRRFRRILPPYWVVLAATIVAVALTDQLGGLTVFSDSNHGFPRPGSVGLEQWIGNATLIEQWRPRVGASAGRWVLGQAWSLSYEEQFYAVMGAVLLLARRRMFAAVVGVTAASLIARHAAPAAGISIDGFFFDGYWPMFACGILIYWQVNYGSRETLWMSFAALGLGLLYCLRESSGVTDLMRHPGTDQSLFLGTLSAVLLLAVHPFDATIAGSGWLRPISYCGRMCYSLYLVHWPITKAISHGISSLGYAGPLATVAVTTPLCLFCSLLVASIFYQHIERPFQRRQSSAI
jgi:peptidoglycan/LPS O-acetylase OafA/YrhL